VHQNTQEPSCGRTKPGHPTVRSAGQVSHSQEAHRRREGSGSREGRGLSRFQGQGENHHRVERQRQTGVFRNHRRDRSDHWL